MNGHRPRTLKREVTREVVQRELGDQDEVKVTVKVERVNEAGELESVVESRTGPLGCGHLAEARGRCGRCGRLLCETDSKQTCYSCGTVVCEACKVPGYSGRIVYHRGRCKWTALFVRVVKG